MDEREQKKAAAQRRRKRNVRVTVAVLVVMLAAAAAFLIWYFFIPSGERMDAAEYFAGKLEEEAGAFGADENADGTSAEGSDADGTADALDEEAAQQKADALAAAERVREGTALAVVAQDRMDLRPALERDGRIYLDASFVTEELNGRFYPDETEGMIIFTTPLVTMEFVPDSDIWRLDGDDQKGNHAILISEDGTWYLDADFVDEYTNVEYVRGEDGCHVLVNYRWGPAEAADVKKESVLRVRPDIHSPILTDLGTDAMVRILETDEKGRWSQAVSPDGFIGYVRCADLTEPGERDITRDFDAPDYTSIHLEEPVRLIWHAMDNPDSNSYLEADTKKMTGMNVISPTWFFMSDNEGHITSLGSRDYIRRAHRKGLQVWGLVSNFDPEVDTYEVLSSTQARRTLAVELIQEAERLDLDGINVDLESIPEKAGPAYVQFLRELSILCRKQERILSVDVPVPMPFNRYFNREELGTVTDYVIIMGYDEHYYGSDAGSVASLSFEENGIRETLASVPAEKVVSGVPLYSRVWYSSIDADGNDYLSSEIISMYKIPGLLEEFGAEAAWDEETGQNYASWYDAEGTLCQIWIEDEASLRLKADLVKTWELGGIAAWALGDEMESVWKIISLEE